MSWSVEVDGGRANERQRLPFNDIANDLIVSQSIEFLRFLSVANERQFPAPLLFRPSSGHEIHVALCGCVVRGARVVCGWGGGGELFIMTVFLNKM